MNLIRVTCLMAAAACLASAAPKVVGGPFVVNVTGRGATVVWIVETEQIGFHPVGEAAKLSPSLHAEKTELTGLQPNTRYEYEVAGIKGSFKTPPTGAEPFQFVLYGDVRTRHDVHRRVIAKIIETGVPDLVLHSGDLVENGYDSSLWANFFDIERNLLRQTAFFPSLGNHERNSKDFYDYFQRDTVLLFLQLGKRAFYGAQQRHRQRVTQQDCARRILGAADTMAGRGSGSESEIGIPLRGGASPALHGGAA